MSAPLSTWVTDAACAGLPVHVFFSALHNKDMTKRAKAVCSACPVRQECGEFGKDERFGIWGGMTPRERNKHFRDSGDWVDATGSTRRLRALAVLGYGSGHLAREIDRRGWVVPTRHGLTWIREAGVRTEAETADLIAELYADLVKRGPNTEPRSVVARKAAAREGWLGPEAWVGVRMDDPKAKPRTRPARLAA